MMSSVELKRDAGPIMTTPSRSFTSTLLLPFEWLNDLLSRDFRLRRQGCRFRVVAERPERPSRLSTTGPGSRPADSQIDIASQIQIELRQLVNQHTQTRQLMRHLGYIERTLRLGGPDAMNDIPLDVLARGYEQLKSIVRDWSSPGLSELRSRLAMTIAAKEEETRKNQPANSGLSEFFTTTRLQVSEGTASDFHSAQQTWAK